MTRKQIENILFNLLVLALLLFLLGLSLRSQKHNIYFDIKDVTFSVILFFLTILSVWTLILILFHQKVKNKKNDNLTLLLAGFVFTGFGVYGIYAITIKNPGINKRTLEQDYVTYSGVIVNRPHNNQIRGGSTKIMIDKHPECFFNFKGLTLSAKESNIFNNEVKKGDSAYMVIGKKDFKVKLEKSVNPTFWDKHIDYKYIVVYDLKINNRHYIQMKSVLQNAGKSQYTFGFFLTFVVSVFSFFIGALVFWSLYDK